MGGEQIHPGQRDLKPRVFLFSTVVTPARSTALENFSNSSDSRSLLPPVPSGPVPLCQCLSVLICKVGMVLDSLTGLCRFSGIIHLAQSLAHGELPTDGGIIITTIITKYPESYPQEQSPRAAMNGEVKGTWGLTSIERGLISHPPSLGTGVHMGNTLEGVLHRAA